MAPLSMLNGHPDRKKVPGVETNTGPLGHGFPVAVGCALAAQLQRRVVAHLRRARRRRDAGGQQLGGGDDRGPLRARLASPRSSTATACSRARAPRRPSGSSRSPTSGRASAGRCARSTATTTARCSRRSPRRPPASRSPSSPTRSRARACRSSRTASSGITRCPTAEQVRGRARGAHRDDRPARAATPRPTTAARRSPRSSSRSPARTSAIVAVCNDSVGSSNLVGFREEFPDRLINVGIAEQDLVGVGAGLANGGLIPFVSAAAPFLTGRALEQIKADAAYSNVHVVLCGQSPGMAYGELGPTHHSIEDLSWMRAIANLNVVVPADPAQTRAAVRWAAASAGPVYLRIPRFKVPDVTPDGAAFEPGHERPAHRRRRRDRDRHRHDGLARARGRRAAARGGHRRAGDQHGVRRPARRAGGPRRGARDARHRHRRGGHRQRRARRRGRRAWSSSTSPCRCGSSASAASSRPPAAPPSCSTTSG